MISRLHSFTFENLELWIRDVKTDFEEILNCKILSIIFKMYNVVINCSWLQFIYLDFTFLFFIENP